jgi:hypothetical protein
MAVPSDSFKLISLTVVDYYDQAELPVPGSSASLSGIMGGQVLARGTPHEKPHELLLLARISSSKDFSRVPFSNTLGIKSYICQRENARIFLTLPYIFMAGRDIRLGPVPNVTGNNGVSTPFVYSIYFRVARKGNGTAVPPEDSFDLQQQPTDLCFTLVGGDYRALGYRSDTLRVPKEMIAAALHDYQIGHANNPSDVISR